MDNSISIKLGNKDNNMNLFQFHWNAIFKNGTHIFQFEKNGTEHRFAEIKDRFDDLVYFNLTNNAGKMFTVNLTNGLIGYNRLEFPYIESIDKEKTNVRLIYFRRNRIEVGLNNLKEQKRTVTYHLGVQWLDSQGNNRKIILQISEDGSFIIEE